MSKQKILVTDALPYANGKLHLGHIAGSHLPGDIYVRFQRLQGNDVVHIGGTDDHGVPIRLAADKAGVDPHDIVDRYYPSIRDSLERLGCLFDNFSQTSRPIHHDTARSFFIRLYEKGWFEVREVEQLYCPSQDRFLPDRYVEGTCPHCNYDGARGDQCESCGSLLNATQLLNPRSELCDVPLEIRTSHHWYFKLSNAQKDLESWLGTKSDWKDNVLNYCAGWFKQGLEDRPITRDLDWGIDVPLAEAAGKVMYVWFEAVIGYVSSTREWSERIGQPDLWKEYWLNPDCKLVHFLGKDNIVFHAILWPAMLMAHGDFILPTSVPANEFLNIEGRKLSTSRNWAVWLDEFLEEFPPDPLRYYLASIAPESKDSDFAWRDFQSRNNNELADIYGNFINRSLTFIGRYYDGVVPEPVDLNEDDRDILEKLVAAKEAIGDHFEKFQVRAAIREYVTLGNHLNKYFNDQEPWKTRTAAPDRCGCTLYVCVQAVRSLAIIMAPVLPFSAVKIWSMLQLEGTVDQQDWDRGAAPEVKAGHVLGSTEILFTKIDDEVVEAQIAKLGASTPDVDVPESNTAASVETDTISFSDFKELDIRIAEIVSAERIPKADRLLKLKIRIGTEERQIVAGIAQHYEPEQLTGRQIVVLANLEPATIRGVESQGMLLAATNDQGQPILLRPDEDVDSGSRVK